MNVFPADSGGILLDGKPIDYQKTGIGYLPEERGLYPKKIIRDQLIYFAELKGMSRSDAAAAVDRWLERLDMKEYSGKKLDSLSKGNQQKIQLITAVAHDPDIVILDEPFSGLASRRFCGAAGGICDRNRRTCSQNLPRRRTVVQESA